MNIASEACLPKFAMNELSIKWSLFLLFEYRERLPMYLVLTYSGIINAEIKPCSVASF